jgi:predicted DCC family thiol-disulfide oxidoreductase YuxK
MNAVTQSSQGGKFQRIDVTKGKLPPEKDMAAALYNMHVIDAGGHVYAGADGILRIIEEYPRWCWVARVGKIWGFRHLAHGLYRVVASHRRRFNSLIK